jgi:hypothetical protein
MANTMNYILDNLNNISTTTDRQYGGAPAMQSPFKNIMGMAGQTNQKIMNLIGGMGNMTSGYGKYVSMYMSIPCMIYQNMANAVCRLSGTGMFSPKNMMPQQNQAPPITGGNDTDLDENILNDIDEDNLDDDDTLDDDDHLDDDNTIKNITLKQSGGGYKISRSKISRSKIGRSKIGRSKYNYIFNPLTNRKVKLNSKKGKMILSVYLNNYGA